jgi:hypothetical protein
VQQEDDSDMTIQTIATTLLMAALALLIACLISERLAIQIDARSDKYT